MEGAYALRYRVFVEEQGVDPGLERDSLDQQAVRAVVMNSDMVVGTGRLIIDLPTRGIIGRMAVQEPLRRRGLGSRVLSFLEDEARFRGLKRITLHAQLYASSSTPATATVKRVCLSWRPGSSTSRWLKS